MTTKLPRITNLILALLLTAGLGCAEATDIKQTLIRTDQQLNAAYKALTKKNGDRFEPPRFSLFPFTRFGTIDGKIISLSKDAISLETVGFVYNARVAMNRTAMQVESKQVKTDTGYERYGGDQNWKT